ncbi:MAG TPA: hypothetical protein VNF68_14210 [Candidatus Baltobacteraceae bacterium]|nr:hypothetical protein [Candidatus Baltobacteraceae bacterium]
MTKRALCRIFALAIAALLVMHSSQAEAKSKNAGEHNACPEALRINTSINGKDDHNDQISAVFELWAMFPGKGKARLGYEYQTYGGRELVSFFVAFSNSGNLGNPPLFPFDGSVWGSFRNALQLAHASPQHLGFPFSSLTPRTAIVRTRCSDV